MLVKLVSATLVEHQVNYISLRLTDGQKKHYLAVYTINSPLLQITEKSIETYYNQIKEFAEMQVNLLNEQVKQRDLLFNILEAEGKQYLCHPLADMPGTGAVCLTAFNVIED